MEDIKLWLWFTLAMGGHKTLARALYKEVGSVKTIYEYTKSDYLAHNITNEKRLSALCDKTFKQAEDTLWFAEKYGVRILPIDSPEYPQSLKEIYDPPLVLYVRGEHFEPNNEVYIAMVGTKDADKYGYEMAYHLAKDLASAISNKKVQDNLRDGLPYPYTEQDGKEFISAMLAADENDTFAFAITADGKVVGSIGAFRQENIHSQTAELGYYIAEEYWGKGIMTEAVKQLCDYIFTHTDIIRIYAEPFAYNVGSCRVLEKAGFQYEGTLRSNAVKNGELLDMKMYARLRKEV